jgi:hypothetical protein
LRGGTSVTDILTFGKDRNFGATTIAAIQQSCVVGSLLCAATNRDLAKSGQLLELTAFGEENLPG